AAVHPPLTPPDGDLRTLGRRLQHKPSRAVDRLSLAVPALVAAAATLNWFPFTKFMAGGDITPFVRDGIAAELTDYWNHGTTGAGANTPVIGRLLEIVLLSVTRLFGASDVIAQHLLYAVLFGFVAFGAAYLVRAFVDSPFAVL